MPDWPDYLGYVRLTLHSSGAVVYLPIADYAYLFVTEGVLLVRTHRSGDLLPVEDGNTIRARYFAALGDPIGCSEA